MAVLADREVVTLEIFRLIRLARLVGQTVLGGVTVHTARVSACQGFASRCGRERERE